MTLYLGALYLYTSHFDVSPKTKTFIDRHGEVIGTLNPAYNGLQTWTPIKNIPQRIIDQTLKKEDRFFYRHPGVNLFAIIRAGLENLQRGKVVRGGSTITQQLAKNLIQEINGSRPERTWLNKLRETYLALGLEIKHGKDWILERYLNTIYYGHRCYGITAAATYYFSKELSYLTKEEIEFLVSRPKAPNRAVPFVIYQDSMPLVGQHFIELLNQSPPSDPVVKTTLDLKLQKKLEQMVSAFSHSRIKEDPLLNLAAVVVDVKAGDLLAMIGSRDYFNDEIDGQFNAATASRQPGSALKPFTYFAAFARGFSPETRIVDEPTSFHAKDMDDGYPYIPQNFDRRYHGEMSIKQALANSYNVPAVITLNEIGMSFYHEILREFGFTTLNYPPDHYGLSITLGSGEVNLLELTNAYAALARGGSYLPYRFSFDEKIVREKSILSHSEHFSSQISEILSDPTLRLKAFGFNEDLKIDDHSVAVKTGTSFLGRDNWTIGYSPKYAVGVWVGHSDSSPLNGTTGASGAGPLWHAIIETLIRGSNPEKFEKTPKIALNPAPYRKTITKISENLDLKIIAPLPHAHYRVHPFLPEEHQMVLAKAFVDPKKVSWLRWYLNDEFFEETPIPPSGKPRLWIPPVPGKYTLKVESSDGSEQTVPFKIEEVKI